MRAKAAASDFESLPSSEWRMPFNAPADANLGRSRHDAEDAFI